MSEWAVILLLVHHPLFYFNQTIVGPFDILQHLLCAWISFALSALMRKISQLRRTHDSAVKASSPTPAPLLIVSAPPNPFSGSHAYMSLLDLR
jgi:hypothetical protein